MATPTNLPITHPLHPANRRPKPADPLAALRASKAAEVIQKVLWDRISLTGAVTLASVTYNLFSHTKSANPDLTNVLNANQMGPNESFLIEGVALAFNTNANAAGIAKFLQEGRLRIGVGPDDIEKVLLPLSFITTPLGLSLPSAPNNVSQTPAAFMRLRDEQAIYLEAGNGYSVRIIQGPNAPALAAAGQSTAADIFDGFVQLIGEYAQVVARG